MGGEPPHRTAGAGELEQFDSVRDCVRSDVEPRRDTLLWTLFATRYPDFDPRPLTSNNEHMVERARKRLRKRARRGFRGYPIATVALYGPDDTTATKLTVGIFPAENVEVTDLRRWFSEGADIRNDAGVAEEVLAFIEAAGAKSIVMTERIIGCPHEEGIDYEGSNCPSCPFWAGRDRWTGRRLH